MSTDDRIRGTTLDWLSLLLVVVGALNWGLVGLGMYVDVNLNLVDLAFGAAPAVEALVYMLLGLAGLYELYVAYRLYAARGGVAPGRAEYD